MFSNILLSMNDMKYCLCCGEDVPYHIVERGDRKEVVCSNCGFPLEVDVTPEVEPVRKNTVAFVAEDSDGVRNIIVDMLEHRHYVERVVACTNGVELVKAVADMHQKKFVDKEEIGLEFAIIDLNMPEMDGIAAARAIRSAEEGYKTSKMPFLFFSAIVANEKIRDIFKSLSPSVYINKGKDIDKATLTARVDALLKYIDEKLRKKPD